MLAGNGLVPGTPKQLAAKADICKGAVPRRHSHFFTAAGQFGSVDLVLGFAPLLLGFALLLAPRVVREIAFGFLDVVVGPEG